jgi:hypothetical protein
MLQNNKKDMTRIKDELSTHELFVLTKLWRRKRNHFLNIL